LLSILKPKQAVASIFDINLQHLKNCGYYNIIIDLDNTITAWKNHQISGKLRDWILKAKEKGFHICLLSNNKQDKVQIFASKLDIIAAPIGGKPFSKAFFSALNALNGNIGNTVVIGDQVFTDILGGNWIGLYTILVDPIDKDEFIGTKFTRLMERLIAGRRLKCESHQQQR
jgi:HAD superfamily phosphatase (TIGR01668 family)